MCTIALGQLYTLLEANTDSRGLRDLSSSVVNRTICEPWVYLALGLESLLRGLKDSNYSRESLITELNYHPECMTEFVRYHGAAASRWSGDDAQYQRLKANPPKTLPEALSLITPTSNPFIVKLSEFLSPQPL
jgi:hypothetical protein